MENNVREMARRGYRVDVIAPRSVLAELKYLVRPKREASYSNESVRLFSPIVPVLSERFSPMRRARASFNGQVRRTIVYGAIPKSNEYDFIYAQFLSGAEAALSYASRRNVPLIVHMGESSMDTYLNRWSLPKLKHVLNKCDLLLPVSKKNYDFVLAIDSRYREKTRIVPNGVDTSVFYPRDKCGCRTKLGLPTGEKIAIFVGHFIERKGPQRVSGALEKIGIRGIFIGGNGIQVPRGETVLFAGPVLNSELPIWLNSADVFVLPSLDEGMSNAILEAAACGLPLVVSDRSFNKGFIPSSCGYFCDPADIEDIARGISVLLDARDPVGLQDSCVQLAEKKSIRKRIDTILGHVGKLSGDSVYKEEV